MLVLLGGAAGVAVGALATVVCASAKHWAVVIPATAWAGGIAAAIATGAIAGLLPALRAARLSPRRRALGRPAGVFGRRTLGGDR
jgi:putative ABC transport system permease protein